MITTLVSCDELAGHLTDPSWCIIDCRFDLADPAWGFASYQNGHIPGAVYANLNHDLSSLPDPKCTGRHPLPDLKTLGERLSAWGISADTHVVVYDTNGDSYAARLWLLLRYLRHDNVSLLDGGFTTWQLEKRPLSDGVETRQATVFPMPANPRHEMIATHEDVEQMRLDPACRLIDARSPERYRGEQELIDPVAGHIPGAVNRFHGLDLQTDGRFKPAAQLRQEFETLLEKTSPEKAVVYCGSGVTSAHLLAAMQVAGLPGARIYLGSWSEWIKDPARARS